MVGLASGLAQEQFEELFFDGGLEAADEGGGVGAQGAGEVVALEDEVAGTMDGAEEGDRFAVEEGGVADEGDGRAVGGDVGRAGLIACDLQGNRSGVGGGRLYGHGFERGKIQIVGVFREIEHLDPHHLVGFIEIEDDARARLPLVRR